MESQFCVFIAMVFAGLNILIQCMSTTAQRLLKFILLKTVTSANTSAKTYQPTFEIEPSALS